MKLKTLAVSAAAAAMVAALALTGCASGGETKEPVKSDAPAYTLVKEGTLTIGISPDYPPFENLEGDAIVGFEPELAQALGDALGLEIEFSIMNFDSIITAVDAGTQIDVGISGFSIDPERAKTVDFSDSYYIDDLAIAAMKDGEFATEDALNGEGVVFAVQSGTTGEAYILENYPNAVVKPFTNSNDCFAALASGQVNAVCTNAAVVSSMVSVSYTDAAIVKSIATGEEYGIAVCKDNPELLAAINDALAGLKADGTIDALMNKWF